MGTEEAIVFLNPTDTAKDSSNRVSLWMYLIAENEFVKNAPTHGSPTPASSSPRSAWTCTTCSRRSARSADADLLILGRAMQALYGSARTTLINPAAQVAEDLSITLFRRTLDELSRVWEALEEPYRLSVCYQVRVTRVDSMQEMPVSPVLQMTTDYQQLALARRWARRDDRRGRATAALARRHLLGYRHLRPAARHRRPGDRPVRPGGPSPSS